MLFPGSSRSQPCTAFVCCVLCGFTMARVFGCHVTSQEESLSFIVMLASLSHVCGLVTEIRTKKSSCSSGMQ